MCLLWLADFIEIWKSNPGSMKASRIAGSVGKRIGITSAFSFELVFSFVPQIVFQQK